MFLKRPITLASGAGVALALTSFALSASGSSAAELGSTTPLIAYDLNATLSSSAPSATAQPLVLQDQAEDDREGGPAPAHQEPGHQEPGEAEPRDQRRRVDGGGAPHRRLQIEFHFTVLQDDNR